MTKYFAKLDIKKSNKAEVLEVRCLVDSVAPTEKDGIQFLSNIHNHNSWKETFKDRSQRKNYAGKGMVYDENRDAFLHIKPYDSWILNETTCLWEAPSARPDDGKDYKWNELTTSWDEIT
jgi:hypothetical protein